MTKIIVQHFVENLLKVLKVLKTRTALTRNGLAELRFSSARQVAKATSKQRSPALKKTIKKLLKKNEKSGII